METSFIPIFQLLKLTKKPIEIQSECFSLETLFQIAKQLEARDQDLYLKVGNNLSPLQIELLIKESGDYFILKF